MHTYELTPKALRYMIHLLDREIGACGLDTEAGRLAQSMQVYLKTLVPAPRPKSSINNHQSTVINP